MKRLIPRTGDKNTKKVILTINIIITTQKWYPRRRLCRLPAIQPTVVATPNSHSYCLSFVAMPSLETNFLFEVERQDIFRRLTEEPIRNVTSTMVCEIVRQSFASSNKSLI